MMTVGHSRYGLESITVYTVAGALFVPPNPGRRTGHVNHDFRVRLGNSSGMGVPSDDFALQVRVFVVVFLDDLVDRHQHIERKSLTSFPVGDQKTRQELTAFGRAPAALQFFHYMGEGRKPFALNGRHVLVCFPIAKTG